MLFRSDADAQSAEPEETEVERAVREALECGDYAAAEKAYDHAIAQSPADADLKMTFLAQIAPDLCRPSVYDDYYTICRRLSLLLLLCNIKHILSWNY